MVDIIDITKLPDFNYEIDRSIIRFTGIGPRIHEQDARIWPRDHIDYRDETRKILYPELIQLINNNNFCSRIETVLEVVFESLRKCNIMSLFNKHCRLDPGYFDRIPFAINYALEANTDQKKILTLIHQIIMSIDSISRRKNFVVKILFGCDKNFKIYKKHIEWLVRGNARFRRLPIGYFVCYGNIQMDINKVPWLNGLNFTAKCRVFLQFISSMTRFILELLRRYFHITVGNPFGDKLIYFRYDLWQKMQTITISNLIKQEVLHPMKYEPSVAINEVATSRIKFHLKKDNLRLICTKQKNSDKHILYKVKAVLTNVLAKSPNYEKFSLVSLLMGLKQLKAENKQVYVVRADIKDCFPSVDQEKVRSIVYDSLKRIIKDESIPIFKCSCLLRERTTFMGFKKNGFRIIKYTMDPHVLVRCNKYDSVDIIHESRMSLLDFDHNHLRPHLVNCVLRETSNSVNMYNLTKGLRQGSSFSPIFCSIYIQSAFNEHLSDFYNSNDCKLFRYVDDILFMSTDLKKSQEFMVKMLEGFDDYNLRMNLEKLSCNFECPRINDKYCRQEKDFVFHKQRISLNTLECKYDYKFNDVDLQDTIRVSPYSDEESIRKSIEFSKVSAIHLDFELNGLDRVIDNIFEIALLLAHKVVTIILLSFKMRNHQENQNERFLLEVIKLISKRIYLAIKLWSNRGIITNELTYFQIRLITTLAMRVVWSSNKLKHRSIEQERLEYCARRYMMRYLVSTTEFDIDMELVIKRLTHVFYNGNSPFKDLRLPGNSKLYSSYTDLPRRRVNQSLAYIRT